MFQTKNQHRESIQIIVLAFQWFSLGSIVMQIGRLNHYFRSLCRLNFLCVSFFSYFIRMQHVGITYFFFLQNSFNLTWFKDWITIFNYVFKKSFCMRIVSKNDRKRTPWTNTYHAPLLKRLCFKNRLVIYFYRTVILS